jgi:hypothetical protein
LRHTEVVRSVVVISLALVACAHKAPWNTDPGIDGHVAFFPLSGGGAHDGIDCNQCHGSFDSFTQFDCLTCHDQTPTVNAAALPEKHKDVPDYAYTSAACYDCHPAGTGGAPPDHGQYFPVDAGSAHATIQCKQCHSDLKNPRDATQFQCGSCHVASDAALVAKHTTQTSNPRITVAASEIDVNDSSTCLRCHADSQVDMTSAHPRNGQGSPPHERARCLQCHDTFRADKTFAADFAIDPRANPGHGCANCHSRGIPH